MGEIRSLGFGFPNRSDTKQHEQLQKMARNLKFCIKEEVELHYPCSESKGVDLRLCFCIVWKTLKICHS